MLHTAEIDLRHAVQRLRSHKQSIREEAESILLQHPEEALDLLLSALKDEVKKRPRKIAIGLTVMTIAQIIFLVIAVRAFLTDGMDHAASAISSIGPLTGLSIWAGIYFFHPSRFEVNAARMLIQFDEVRAIGPLAEACINIQKGDKIRKTVQDRLQQLLTRLQPEDISLFTEAQYTALNQMLLLSNDVNFALTVLKAYEQLEDHRLMPIVERLTKIQWISSLPRNSLVKQAVANCIAHLKTHAVRGEQTLIRPSENPLANKEALLRPATATEETDVQELVRAAIKD